jgi:hypothetical protein
MDYSEHPKTLAQRAFDAEFAAAVSRCGYRATYSDNLSRVGDESSVEYSASCSIDRDSAIAVIDSWKLLGWLPVHENLDNAPVMVIKDTAKFKVVVDIHYDR